MKLKLPTRGTREDFIYNGTFHEAVGMVLAVAQCFGIMPVSGIREKLPSRLKFKKFSLRFVLCLVYITSLSWIVVMDVIWIAQTTKEFGKLINFIFDFTNLLSIFCFLELAAKWPNLMMKWNEVEKFLPKLQYQMDKQKLAFRIKMVSVLILFISMGRLGQSEGLDQTELSIEKISLKICKSFVESLNFTFNSSGTPSVDYCWCSWGSQLPINSWPHSSLLRL